MQNLINILVQLDRTSVADEKIILECRSCIYMNTNLKCFQI